MDGPTSSLLDRLIGNKDVDNAPVRLVTAGNDAMHGAGISMPGSTMTRRQRGKQIAILRAQIERDLLALFGTRRMSEDTDLSQWPLVERSVMNFGVPDLSGSTGSSLNIRKLQRDLTETIRCFEPRIRPETLNVQCHLDHSSTENLYVQIEGLFGPSDALETFAMGISISLGNGQCHQAGADQRRLAG